MTAGRTIPAAVAALALVALAACGDDADGDGASGAAAKRNVSLEIRFVGRAGRRSSAVLRCRADEVVATGWLARRKKRRLCRRARSLAGFLASEPDRDRICTKIYGGPQRARIHGRIGRRPVDRRFSREDGCEIADWDRVAALLPRLR